MGYHEPATGDNMADGDRATLKVVKWLGVTLASLIITGAGYGGARWAAHISETVEGSATSKEVKDLAREQASKLENLGSVHGHRIASLEIAAAQALGERNRILESYEEFKKLTQAALLQAQEERTSLIRQGAQNETKLESIIRQLAALDAKIEGLRKQP